MERIARQLETVRFAARWMLVGQRLFQWAAVLVVVALGLGLLDYVLRLPDGLRGAIGLAVVVLAGVWIVGRLRAALGFMPALDELALRLERIYPHLSNRLATAVDFTTHAELYRAPQRTASLVAATLDAVRDRLPGVEVRRLLDPTRTVRSLLALLLAAAALAVVVLAAPHHSRIAAERWLTPWGDAEWPRRTAVAAVSPPVVWPVDTPVRLAAAVERGYEPGMRVAVDYRIVDESGAAADAGDFGGWQSLLMTEQSRDAADDRPVFERQIELPEPLVRRLEETGGGATLQFSIHAGDDQTAVETLRLVPRPAVTRVVATVTPPAYARGLVEPQTVALHEQSGQVASVAALRGSTVEVTVGFNKNGVAIEDIGALSGALSPGDGAAAARRLRFTLDEDVETPIRLVDEHGLTNLSERRYRIEAIEDKPPTVSLVQPATDEAVLATAAVPVDAMAQDDVAVRQVRLEATHEEAPVGGQPVQVHEQTLVSLVSRSVDARASHTLDLAQWSTPLEPGDSIVLRGVAEDVFDLDGRRHPPVRSSPRRLRIIEQTTLISQLRDELAAVRQQAVRMEQTQRRLEGEPAPAAAPEQAELTRRVEGQSRLVRELSARAARNRLDEPALRDMMSQSGALLDRAQQASRSAQQRLDEAARADETERQATRERAGEEQQAAAEALGELIQLLDQGRDAFSLELALRQMQAQQGDLAEAARRLFPQTVGQDPASLPQELRDALRDLAEKQRAMSEEARDVVRQMQETAQDLAQQAEDRARAAAEALAEAAATAQRQNLEGSMQQSAQSIGENQLSQAAQEQAQSEDTLRAMLEQMGTQQDRMWAMLRRRLQQVTEAIRELIARQERELAALDAQADDAQLPALEPAEAALRRATMAAEEQARGSQELQAVGAKLGEAVAAEGAAVLGLRGAERPAARQGENDALAALRAALEQVRALEQETAEEQARQQRQELREAYEALAGRQAALREATLPYAAVARLDRKQRAEVVDLGHQQSDIQAEASALREEVAQTLVFQAMHDRIDQATARATRQLRAGAASDDVVAEQERIAALLRTMAAALDEDSEAEPFAGQQASQQGGGGGGGSQARQVVPPAAELKLLRGLQEAIYTQTRAVGEAPADGSRDRLLELSTRQRELSALGERLIESVRNPMGEQPQETRP